MVPSVAPRYKILQEVGRGRMGVVYEADASLVLDKLLQLSTKGTPVSFFVAFVYEGLGERKHSCGWSEVTNSVMCS